MHKLPQPVKLWYWGRSSATRRPRPAASGSSPRSALRRSAPTTPRWTRSSILLLAELLERAGVAGVRLRLSSLGTPETRAGVPATSCAPTCASASPSCPRTCASGSTTNPLRAFDADHPGTRRVMEERPAPARPARARRRRALRRGARAARRGRGCAYEVDTTLVRGLDYYTRTVFEFESARLGAQRGSAAAGATTGSSSSSAGRPPPAWAGPPGWSASCWPPRRPTRRPRRDVFVALAKPDAARARLPRWCGALRERGAAGGDGAGGPLPQGPAEAGRPARGASTW